MKKLQTLNFFGKEGLYVVEDEIDNDKKSMVYLVKDLTDGRIPRWQRIDSVDSENDIIRLEDDKKKYKRKDVIRILGLADIPSRLKNVFVEGSIVETGDSYQTSKSSKHLTTGDLCTIKEHSVVCEILKELPLADDAWDWDDLFEVRIIMKFIFEKKLKKDQVMKVKRRDLAEFPTTYARLKCQCCGHEL